MGKSRTAFLLLGIVCACGRSRQLSMSDLESESKLSVSLQAQAKLLSERADHSALPRNFIEAQAGYIADAADKQERKLSDATPEKGGESLWRQSITRDSAISASMHDISRTGR